ncbi:hypothetical protein BH24CHL6_BH24CHL6_03870 [soil metagenome]
MILTITLNPAIDRTLEVESLNPGAIHRPARVLELAGGKGVNVARAATCLGWNSLAVGIVAGHYGRRFLELARGEGLAHEFISARGGSTRLCTTVLDQRGGALTEYYEPGFSFSSSAWSALGQLVQRLAGQAAAICICGSGPPGTTAHTIHKLLEQVIQANPAGLLVIDTHGPQLAGALAAGPALVKLNREEAQDITEIPISTPQDAARACRRLQEMGARSAIVTLGPLGAVAYGETSEGFSCRLVESGGPWSVGSGDAFVAAAVARLVADSDLAAALVDGTAGGTANSMIMGAGRLDGGVMHRLRRSVILERIST